MDHTDNFFKEENPIIYSIRRGLMLSIPVLMIGSFSLVFKFLPIAIYQTFINNFASGFFLDLFTGINSVTFGVLSVCIVIGISHSYASLQSGQAGVILGGVFTSICVYLIFISFLTESFNILSFGAHGMFTAIFSASVFTAIYIKLVKSKWFSLKFYTMGADIDFNTVLSICVPACITVLLAYILNKMINITFDVIGLEALFHKAVHYIFNMVDNYSLKVVLYVVSSSVFWLFGIHGTNTLFTVETLVFGNEAGILTKDFLDVFVLMGGSGTTISLWLAIMLFGRQHNTKSLAKYSTLPMIFNINEMMVFGLPIVYNITFFIPFLAVPLVCIVIAYFVLSMGLVPLPTNDVNWVTPVIINGYEATGSLLGSLLQVINISVGAFIYSHYLKQYEIKTEKSFKSGYEKLLRTFMDEEKNGNSFKVLELPGKSGTIARIISNDLQHVLKTKELALFYQPQYNSDDKCVGAEALLRWNHPRFGMIYPPLVMAIAGETKILPQLERTIFSIVCEDIVTLKETNIFSGKVSVNVTSVTLYDSSFSEYIRDMVKKYPCIRNVLFIELTEQMSFMVNDDILKKLNEIYEMDIRFAIDDFSMGHTSIKYLQSNLFDLVKLDGSLVKDMMVNSRSEKIVSSIIQMADTMHFNVLAEFVETVKYKEKLELFGCHLFQGYLYSPAISLENLVERLEYESVMNSSEAAV